MTDAVKVKHKPYPIILASTSRYRADLLRQLNLPFSGVAPDYDEAADPLRERLKDEPAALACHHALQKALSLSRTNAASVIIGSDQTGSCNGNLLHKPGNALAARAQLSECAGNEATFHTALAVLLPQELQLHDTRDQTRSAFKDRDWFRAAQAACSTRHRIVSLVETTTLRFRALTADEIDGYLALDEPYDCAGSFKIESHGIGLFANYRSNDPSALIGLPLISLATILRAAGFNLFSKPQDL